MIPLHLIHEEVYIKKETNYFYKYQFMTAAVKVVKHPNIQTNAAAEALNIHPFMLARWKKKMRGGVLRKDHEKKPNKNSPNTLEKT